MKQCVLKYAGIRALSAGKLHAVAQDAQGRHLAAQGDVELHLGGAGLCQRLALQVGHAGEGEGVGPQVGAYDLQGVTFGEFVAQAAQRQAVFIAAFHNGADLPLPDVS